MVGNSGNFANYRGSIERKRILGETNVNRRQAMEDMVLGIIKACKDRMLQYGILLVLSYFIGCRNDDIHVNVEISRVIIDVGGFIVTVITVRIVNMTISVFAAVLIDVAFVIMLSCMRFAMFLILICMFDGNN